MPQNDFELPVDGFQGTPEEIERQWFEQVYTGRGDSMLQLTWRAVLMGSLLGGVLSLTNLYIGLKSRLGIRRGHHRLHPLLRDLDRAVQGRLGRIANDHPGKQLHAIDGQFGGLLDRRHAHLRRSPPT